MATGRITNQTRQHLTINLDVTAKTSLHLEPFKTSRVLTADELASREIQTYLRKRQVSFTEEQA